MYDSAHVGHASNYVRFDVVRRILSDYFGYDVTVHMNVTDIDDKIIKRANERHITFESLAREYEVEFLDDMDSLNVRRPDVLTRVSEYIPEVTQYIEQIMRNGFAYENRGSVYFDTRAFGEAGYTYGKLEPTSVGNQTLIAEGEGSLTATDEAMKNDKKDPSDFVLWKRSKPNEPSWDSPWGKGRPGWHIECSVVASCVFGSEIDIHAGGVDLRFPHHSNEIAQAEAHYCSHRWVNYFMHAGHLHIEGLKMSKSLKNFITIRNCLERYNARQLRLVFLGHRYDAPMNYADHVMAEAVSLDRTFVDFFGNLRAALRESDIEHRGFDSLRWTDNEKELSAHLARSQDVIHHCLADNFNTPDALLEVQTLIRATNAYLTKCGQQRSVHLLQSVGHYISRILRVFGLTRDGHDEITYGDMGSSTDRAKESKIGPLLDAFSTFRDSIRNVARGEGSVACKQILQLCDEARDGVLPQLGVRLEDRGVGQASLWKLEDAGDLVKEIKRKKEIEAQRIAEKQTKAAEREAKEKADLEKGKISPIDMFREGAYHGRFSCFDGNGFPLKDKDGKDLSKSTVKGLRKARQRQEKLHFKYVNTRERSEDVH